VGVSAESADVRVEKAGTVKGRDATSGIEVAEELAPDLSADSPDSTDPALTADSESVFGKGEGEDGFVRSLL